MTRHNLTRHTRRKRREGGSFPACPDFHFPSGRPRRLRPGAFVSKSPGGEAAGIEALVQILVEKGLVTKEEAAATMRKKGEPGASGLAALTELLKAKGVLSTDEADKVAKSAEPMPLP